MNHTVYFLVCMQSASHMSSAAIRIHHRHHRLLTGHKTSTNNILSQLLVSFSGHGIKLVKRYNAWVIHNMRQYTHIQHTHTHIHIYTVYTH